MSWTNSEDKSFKTIDELKAKVKADSSHHVSNSASDTEPEMIPEVVKKPTKKTAKKTKKQELASCNSSNPNTDPFTKDLDLYDLDVLSDGKCAEENKPSSIDLVETRLVIKTISKSIKDIAHRIAALRSVIHDLDLTDIPKNTGQAIKEVDKLKEALCNLGVSVPPPKQQRKKAK
ncbi:late transcription factor VLTF-4 [Fowlpox virus]|uniref:ORF FPV142 Late transcription factor VLTF-4 n=2 Tax=Fowlpox virus TaxID=10261 RepID=Q9J588_FOWPN|nr:late transcription factor VLTF-4 [Fowlpox virus]UNS14358.1 ALPV-194 [Albatrosspox virus]WPD90849.1 late transcription factor VLTF-4 [Avipoxvirus sp.]CAE52681.1 late transcription factor, H5R/VLTF-4 orthologue [Fowlpox virus isolate HP-438/Munich]AAF44486.1 ORF FPV142 Late transcription factor VLTF-4 [Fowlpox virus]ART91575.1 late transcription factor [Fowlpox virus]